MFFFFQNAVRLVESNFLPFARLNEFGVDIQQTSEHFASQFLITMHHIDELGAISFFQRFLRFVVGNRFGFRQTNTIPRRPV